MTMEAHRLMSRRHDDNHYMRLAIAEARKGEGRTTPNPCVGTVIVKKNVIVGTGFHQKAGTPHAEIHALRAAGEAAAGATLYVTLEPCNHTGQTPPCTQAIVASNISRVVVGMRDPNPLVDGSGIHFLKSNGIKVDDGVLQQECEKLNQAFIKYITKRQPLIALKAGVSLDGKLSYAKETPGWITGPESKIEAHRLRDRYDAILVGRKTVTADNPALTTRLPDGQGRDPVRIILDTSLTLPPSAKVFNLQSDAPTMVFCRQDVDKKAIKELEARGVIVKRVKLTEEGRLDLHKVVTAIAECKLLSVLVEGGSRVHSAFLQRGLADKVYFFYAPLFAGSQGESLTTDLVASSRQDAISLQETTCTRLGDDLLVKGVIRYSH